MGLRHYRRAFRYLTWSMEVPIMALVGYIIGKELNGLEAHGAILGAVLGIFLLWFNLYKALKEFEGGKTSFTSV